MATLSKYIEQEKSVFDSTRHLFQPEIRSFDMLDLAGQEVAKSINAGQASDTNAAYFMAELWQVVYSYMRISFLITLRGSTQEAFATLRTAIEMTSHFGTVGLSPTDNSIIWLNQNEKAYKGKYKKTFKPLFPKKIQGMSQLEKAYYHCCDIGAHAGRQQLERRSGVVEKDGKGEYLIYSLNVDGINTCGALLYILTIAKCCLYVFDFCFSQTLKKEGFEPVRATVKAAVREIENTVSLRERQKEKFLKGGVV